ncbi:Formin_homology 2 domain-containing protein [Hexamita inflata]|uniref:Formin homology 2 domain-containing protein n=1 Tax=Hexamita inflata TaxID=28002 RepID=A0AA86QXJ5_9EUKA|nr:Formin homology 2 domain-containing protein [Hexamita inflata]
MQDEEFNVAFLQYLDQIQTPSNIREQMLQKFSTKEQKIQFMSLCKQQQIAKQGQKDHHHYIRTFKEIISTNILVTASTYQELFECIKSDNQFATKFREQRGLHYLFVILEKTTNLLQALGQDSFQVKGALRYTEQHKDEIDANELIIQTIMQCLRRLMDSEDGLHQTVNNQIALLCLQRVLYDTHLQDVRELALYILSVLCLLPKKFYAIGQILNSLGTYAIMKGVSRFHALLSLGRSSFPKPQEQFKVNQLKVIQNIGIILANLTNQSFNTSIQSRAEIRIELEEAGYNQYDRNLMAAVSFYMKQQLKSDQVNKFHDFARMLKNIDDGTIPEDYLMFLEDYVSSELTPETVKNDQCVKSIVFVMRVREQFIVNAQQDKYLLESLESQQIQTEDLNYVLQDSIQDLGQRMANQHPVIAANFKESILDLIAILKQADINQEKPLLYIFEGLNAFTKKLLKFKIDSEQRGIDEIFSIQAEGQQLGNYTLYDVLRKQETLSANYLVKELEQMIGESAVDVIRKSKQLACAMPEFQSGLDISAFRVKNQLRIVQIEEYEKIKKITKLMSEKEAIIQSLESDLAETIKDNRALKQSIKDLKVNGCAPNTGSGSGLGSGSGNGIGTGSGNGSGSGNGVGNGNGNGENGSSGSFSQNDTQSGSGVGGNGMGGNGLLPPSNGLPLPPPTNGVIPPPPFNNLPLPPPMNMNLPVPGIPPPNGLKLGVPPGIPTGVPGLAPDKITKKRAEINIPTATVKPIFWDKLKDNEIKGLWQKVGADDIRMNQEYIQILDAALAQKKVEKTANQSAEPQKPKLITVLDSKKQQAIAIVLQKFKLTPDQIYQKIMQMKDLTEIDSGVDNLVQSCPNADDISQVKKAFESEPDIEKYGKPEQYVIKVASFPKLSQRLLNWQFLKSFHQELQKYKPVFSAYNKFFDFLMTSRKFHLVLKSFLTIGNFLNAGTARGQAFGFKLKTLAKYFDTKDNTGKPIAVHAFKLLQDKMTPTDAQLTYTSALKDDAPLANQNDDKTPIISLDELYILSQPCKKNSFPDNSDQFQKFFNHLKQIKSSMSSFTASKSDNYEQLMQKFVDTAEFQVEKIQELQEAIKEKIEKSVEFFAENKNVKYEEFVQYFYDFANNAFNTVQELRNEEENENKKQTKIKIKEEIIEDKGSVQKLVAKVEEKEEKLTAAADGLMDGLMQGFINAGGKKRR